MGIQLLFCVETNKRANTDYIYIKDTIDKYFILNNEVKLTPVYMTSKMKFNSKDVIDTIQRKTKDYANLGSTVVIYCVDMDDYDSNPDHLREFKQISEYCSRNGYEFAWFCHDIEDVYLGKRISDNLKVTEAGKFRKGRRIDAVDINRLQENTYKCHASNIVTILKKYLDAK